MPKSKCTLANMCRNAKARSGRDAHIPRNEGHARKPRAHLGRRSSLTESEGEKETDALANIDPNLHTFFVPQMEQLSMRQIPTRCGMLCETEAEWGRGHLWVMGIGDGCLISVHDVEVAQPFTLREYPDDFTCLAAMSSSTVRATEHCTPLTARDSLLKSNLVSFRQHGGEVAYEMQPEQRYTSSTITLTPRFFKRLGDLYHEDADMLAETLATTPMNTLPAELDGILRSLDPRRANLPGANMYFTSKVMEAISVVMGHAAPYTSPDTRNDSSESRKIAYEAKELIEENLGDTLTLQGIADRIYVSRTHLCTAFKQETGMSVGEYLRDARMRRACELLSSTNLPISEVSRTVGYARQSSFAEAFKEHAGITPSEWRRGSRP